jgi:hypothetical protein
MAGLRIAWIVLAGLAATPALAAPAAPTTSFAPCAAVVQVIRNAGTRASGPSFGFQGRLAQLLRAGAPEVKDPALAKKAARLLDLADPDAIRLQRLDGQVWRASTIEGSADCTTDGFFRVKPDGSLTAVRTPPSFAELCFTSGRSLGVVAGRPALIETDSLAHPDLGLDVEVTPWDGRWGAACRAALRFNDSFQVSERFCGDKAVCEAGAAAAPGLARSLARSGGDGPDPAPGVALDFVNSGGGLETFGARAKTRFPNFSDTAVFLPVTVAGRRLTAHVSVGGVGERPMGDYLMTLYPRGDADHPLAGYVVERRPVALKSAAVSRPKPWVNSD